jgi:WD40 repeat protein
VNGWRQAEENGAAREQALKQSEALGLTYQYSALLPENPGLALLLAVEAAERGRPRHAAHNHAVLAALAACRERRTFAGQGAGFGSAVFSPDDRLVATVPDTQQSRTLGEPAAQVWDTASGRLLLTLRVPGLPCGTLQFSPDSRLLLATFAGHAVVRYRDGPECLHTDRAVRLREVATGREVRVLKGHTGRVESACFSPDGKRILTASDDGALRLWDAGPAPDFAVVLRGRERAGSFARGLARFSPDGRRLFTAFPLGISTPSPCDPAVRVWDAASGRGLAVLKGLAGSPLREHLLGPLHALDLSPDGERLVTASRDVTAHPVSLRGAAARLSAA